MDLLGKVDPQRGHFSAKMYAKTKELCPIGGVHQACPSRSANENKEFQPKSKNFSRSLFYTVIAMDYT